MRRYLWNRREFTQRSVTIQDGQPSFTSPGFSRLGGTSTLTATDTVQSRALGLSAYQGTWNHRPSLAKIGHRSAGRSMCAVGGRSAMNSHRSRLEWLPAVQCGVWQYVVSSGGGLRVWWSPDELTGSTVEDATFRSPHAFVTTAPLLFARPWTKRVKRTGWWGNTLHVSGLRQLQRICWRGELIHGVHGLHGLSHEMRNEIRARTTQGRKGS